jgi:hypothetical protein
VSKRNAKSPSNATLSAGDSERSRAKRLRNALSTKTGNDVTGPKTKVMLMIRVESVLKNLKS